MNDTYSLRIGRFSRIINIQTLLVVIGLIFLTICQIFISLSLGKVSLSLNQVFQALSELSIDDKSEFGFIVNVLRLPRVILAALVGISLSISGLILQSIIRNPLASPDVLGITTGASASTIFFISFLAPYLSMQLMPFFSIVGAWIVALIIYILAWHKGVTPTRLILVGIAVSALMSAVTTLLLVLSPLSSSLSAYIWLTGSVYGAAWSNIKYFFVWLAVLLPFLIGFSRCITLHELDNDLMLGLGLKPERERMYLLSLAVALAAVAIAYAGAISFIGLIAPHIAKRLVARTFSGLLITSALIGANLVILADLIGRTVFLPLDLPAGIFVAVMGTPFFVYLLIKNNHTS